MQFLVLNQSKRIVMLPEDLQQWFVLKEREFHAQGYSAVVKQDIEEFFVSFFWKRKMPKLYTDQVNDIVHLTPNQFFDYKTMAIQSQPNIALDSINLLDLT